MPPVPLNPHSCQRCQSLIIDQESRPPHEDRGEGHNYIHFNFLIADIVTAAADGCSFCRWLLDTEWVHRASMVDQVLGKNPVSESDSNYKVILAVPEASIRQDVCLPPPNPATTLRKYLADNQEVVSD